MFRIRSVTLFKGTSKKEYHFSDNAYVYGHNSVGKTALTKVIDFVLGSTDMLSHDGLDHLEIVGAYIVNNNTELWIQRTLNNEYYYKRTKESGYTLVSLDTYKEIICEVITESADSKAIEVYQRVFDERPTFRAFTFLNFVDEIGQGDLGSIFTRGKETKHLVRIRNIMDFFFNYRNIEKIYEKRVELDDLETEQKMLNNKLNQYNHSIEQIVRLFSRIGLECSDDMSENFDIFKAYQKDFTRKKVKKTDDLVYLTRASHSLSEEIKFYSFLKEQSKTTINRKVRTEQLLSILQSLIFEEQQYAKNIDTISNAIKEIQQDKLILSLSDYDSSIVKIAEQKKSIDKRIEQLKNQACEIDYEQTLKVIALLEENFTIINSTVDITRVSSLNKEISNLKRQIKALRNNYDQTQINNFNNRLTEMYLSSDVQSVHYLNDDRNEEEFSLVFDPFSQVLVAKHKEGHALVSYTPGSMARHNHLQLLVYLCMFEYLHKHFSNFIYLPVLIIDSADQPMEDESFEEIYPSLVEIAKCIGVQTIFISKYKPITVEEPDLVDITEGLNPFHI